MFSLSLSMCQARSREVAQYLVEVPTFWAAISDTRFLSEDSLTRSHGLVWPLLLRAGNRQSKTPALERYNQAENVLNHEVCLTAELGDVQELVNNTLVLTVSRFQFYVCMLLFLVTVDEHSGNLTNRRRISWMSNMCAYEVFLAFYYRNSFRN